MNALAILTDLIEDPDNNGVYHLNVAGERLAELWRAIEQQEEELRAFQRNYLPSDE